MAYDADTAIGGGADRFPSTRGSYFIGTALDPAALPRIAEVYWKPVYKHIRRRWQRTNEDAKDLTQGFFAHLVERDLLAKYDASRASLRTYLRLCLDAFVASEHEAAGRWKRGGANAHLSLDFDTAESELAATDASPEDVFHREWQRETLTRAIAVLHAEASAGGRREQFEIFARYDLATGDRPTYDALASEFGLPATQVTNYLAAMRRRLRALVAESL